MTGRSDAGAPDRPPRSVLIVLTGSLGDLTRALPLAAVLKARWPGASLTWLVDTRWEPLLAGHPHIDRRIAFERSASGLGRVFRALRTMPVDVALDLQRGLKSGVCTWLSRASRRVGVDRRNAREANSVFTNERVPYCPPHVPKLRHYLMFAEHLGCDVPDALDFGLQALTGPGCRPPVLASTGPFVALAAGSSWPSKDWTVDGYVQLARRVAAANLTSVLVGGPADGPVAEAVEQAVGPSHVLNLAGRTSLPELVATLAAARAAVGPDSGPGHLAAAVGTPYVALVGPTDPDRVAPYRCRHLAVRSPIPCPPCPRRRCTRREGRCMAAITGDMAWEGLAPLVTGA